MKKKLYVGNWKMNLTLQEADDLVASIMSVDVNFEMTDFGFAPSSCYIHHVGKLMKNFLKPVKLYAQNIHDKESGAYTGEISARMLNSIGCGGVILGHSERRHVFGETDELINSKVQIALRHDLNVILCVGETLNEREAGVHKEICISQVGKGLKHVDIDNAESVVIAYEPVWAIGTGQNATPKDAQEIHEAIRSYLCVQFGPVIGKKMRILYGGSVKPDNVAQLMRQPDIDGALIGGASLQAEDFVKIINHEKI